MGIDFPFFYSKNSMKRGKMSKNKNTHKITKTELQKLIRIIQIKSSTIEYLENNEVKIVTIGTMKDMKKQTFEQIVIERLNAVFEFIKEQREHNKKVDQHIVEQKEFNKQQLKHNKKQEEHNKKADERLNCIEQDIQDIKACPTIQVELKNK